MLKLPLLLLSALALLAQPALAAPREVKLGHIVEENTPLQQQALLFKAEIEKRLPGQFNIVIFPNNQLGNESAQIDALRVGSQDMAVIASGATRLSKKVGVFDLPWLFKDRAHVIRALNGPLGADVRAELEKRAGLKVLGIYENGFRHVLNKVRAVNAPADLKGLKIRVTGGKFRQDVFALMGANPSPIAWGETFGALQTGVVDGAEAAIYGFNSAKLYEVADRLSLTRHVYSPSFLMASNTFMASLTEAQRKAFQAAGEAITAEAYRQAATLEDTAMAEMQKADVKVNEVDFDAFQKATRPVYKTYTDGQGDDWIKLIDAARAGS